MKYLITGSAGFIGKHLVRSVLELGHTVYSIVKDNYKFEATSPKGMRKSK